MEFDGDTDKYIYTAEVKTSLYILVSFQNWRID